MKVRRELLPIVISLIFLILAREIYPYAGVMVAEIHDEDMSKNHCNRLRRANLLVFHEDVLHVSRTAAELLQSMVMYCSMVWTILTGW